jgi:CDP-diacylglycerol--glycerol-3-phosphate 3-phosphatidyltransferase
MVSRRIQQRARQFAVWLIQPLARSGVSPNTLTVIGLLLSFLAAVVLALGFLFIGGLFVLFAGIFDMFDGAMARVLHRATTFGAFFDSTLDRYSESIILLGLLVYVLQRPGFHSMFWPFANEQTWMIVFIFLAVVGSLMVSYTKARAEGLGLECKTGILARPERVVVLTVGLLTGTSIWAMAVLAVLSNLTAIERMVYVWRITALAASSNTTHRAATASHASALVSAAHLEQVALQGMPEGQNVINRTNDTSAGNTHSPTSIVGMNEGHE